jgi:hypothetical protein
MPMTHEPWLGALSLVVAIHPGISLRCAGPGIRAARRPHRRHELD